jgi:hypothetical protein
MPALLAPCSQAKTRYCTGGCRVLQLLRLVLLMPLLLKLLLLLLPNH